MDHSITTRWGGRKGRYKEFKGSVSRNFDPFGGQPVEFAKELEYEAWLRQRFCGLTRHITTRSTRVAADIGGKSVDAVATFVVDRVDGERCFYLIGKDKVSSTALSRLRRVAKASGGSVVVQLASELRADVAVFWRLDRLRQLATIHLRSGNDRDDEIIRAVQCGSSCRSQLLRALAGMDPQILDARIALLHCSHRLTLNAASCDFAVSIAGDAGK